MIRIDTKNNTTIQNEAIIKELVKALVFYADVSNWERDEAIFGNHRLPSVAMMDDGHIARQTLKTISEEA